MMRRRMHLMTNTILAAVLGAAAALQGQTASIAATPPMGWNSWNHFAERVTDKDIRGAADSLVSTGMRDAGYIYVNIDDTWEGKRDAQGRIQANDKFPDMKALTDYVHAKGLKIGIYSSPGPKTCGGYEGSLGHEEQDAQTYAAWGFDYLKYDLCSFNEAVMQAQSGGDQAKSYALMKAAYLKMDRALKATGRPIVFSLCQYGFGSVWQWGPEVGGNLWRTTTDIRDDYQSMAENGFTQAGLSKYAGPGHWGDPDMLEIGNGKMTANEYRTHMSLWALLAAPLLAGNDLTRMTESDRSILMNHDAIAIDQDPLGRQGDRLSAIGPYEVWSKPLKDGGVAVGLFNRGEDAASMALPGAPALGLKSVGAVRNVWTPSDAGRGPWMVPSHGVVLLLVH